MQRSSVLSGALADRAPHLEELERKRLMLERVRVSRDAVLLNRGKVTGDPTKEYVWVNLKEERQIWFQTQGFSICKDSEIQCSIKQREDGTYLRGDLILYEVDKEYFDALHEYNVVRGIEYIDGAEQNFEASAMRDGVPVFKPKVH